MKTPKEWFEEELSGEPLTQESVIEVLEMVQEEAIEETVKLCYNNAKIEIQQYFNNQKIILEDEKVFFGSDYPESCYSGRVRVNKDSILNCAKFLKQQL